MNIATFQNLYDNQRLSVQIISARDLPSTEILPGVSRRAKDTSCAYFCTVNFYLFEIGRTELNGDKHDGNSPVWHTMLSSSISVFKSKEREFHRPYNLEYLDLEVFLQSGSQVVKCAIGCIYLSTISKGPQNIQLIHADGDENGRHAHAGIILVNLSLENALNSEEIVPPVYMCLRQVLCSGIYPQYGHLFMDFECSSYGHIGSFMLPGPKCGEVVRDKYDSVMWKLDGPGNQFGDNESISLKGSLIITDLRILFIPYEISGIPSLVTNYSI